MSCLSNWKVRIRARALMDQLHLNKSFFLRILQMKMLSIPSPVRHLLFTFLNFVVEWLIGNRTSCRSIHDQSVIILVIKQIGLPLCGHPILLITHMITDQTGLHSVLLPLYIIIYTEFRPNYQKAIIYPIFRKKFKTTCLNCKNRRSCQDHITCLIYSSLLRSTAI